MTMKNETASAVPAKVRRTVAKYRMFEKGAQVVVGLSGGPDSLCLFDVLLGMAEEWDLTLIPVHINHGLRGEASDGDQSFCSEFCGKRGLDLRVTSIDCAGLAEEMGVSTETAGRIKRYEAFGRAAEEAMAATGRETVIAVAHNADDRVETVLQHLLRGTGTSGLASIPYVRDMELPGGGTVKVVRPVLEVTREEIEAYCEEAGLEPRRDATNDEPLYARNRIRLELISELERYSPGVRSALTRLADFAMEDEAVLSALADKAFDDVAEGIPGGIKISGEGYRRLDPAVGKRVLKKGLAAIGLTEDITRAHYDAMTGLIETAGPSGRIELPRGYRLEMEYGEALLLGPEGSGAETPDAPVMPRMKAEIITTGDMAEIRKFTGDRPSQWLDGTADPKRESRTRRVFLDAESLCGKDVSGPPEELVLRTRRPGDRIRIKSGTKKLQDLMVDMKIPKRLRDSIPLVALGSQVLWMGGEKPRYTVDHPVTEATKKVLYIELVYEI